MKYDKTNLHVYKMNDCEWWLSHLSIEETRELFLKEYGLDEDECPIDEIYEEDINTFTRYDEVDYNNMNTELLLKFSKNKREGIRYVDYNGKKYDGIYNEWFEISNIDRILEIDGEYTEPYLVACTEY